MGPLRIQIEKNEGHRATMINKVLCGRKPINSMKVSHILCF